MQHNMCYCTTLCEWADACVLVFCHSGAVRPRIHTSHNRLRVIYICQPKETQLFYIFQQDIISAVLQISLFCILLRILTFIAVVGLAQYRLYKISQLDWSQGARYLKPKLWTSLELSYQFIFKLCRVSGAVFSNYYILRPI